MSKGLYYTIRCPKCEEGLITSNSQYNNNYYCDNCGKKFSITYDLDNSNIEVEEVN